MNRNTKMSGQNLNQAMGNLNLDSPSQSIKVPPINEFIPMSHQQRFYPRKTILESPESSPAAVLAHNMTMNMPTASQVHQENVGGTTYFYPTPASESMNASSINMNAPGLNTPASIGAESCLPGALGPQGASPYATQMFAAAPQHMPPMNMKPVAAWQPVALPGLVPIPIGFAQPQPCICNNVRCPGYISPRYMAPQRFNTMFSPQSDFRSNPDNSPAPDFTKSLAVSFYQPDVIRQEIYERNQCIMQKPDQRLLNELPKNVEMYSEIVPIENPSDHALATSYRGTHRRTGLYYALRRLHSFPTVPTKRLDMWQSLDHSNVARLCEYFATQAFGDHSFVLVYTFHPGCQTLIDKYLAGGASTSAAESSALMDPFSSDPDAPRPYTHLKNTMLRAVACGALLPEAVLWSLLVQLSAGLRAVHNAGLACRNLDATKVIINGPRVRIAWGGAAEVAHANTNDLLQAQQDDLTALGRLALALACRSIHIDNLGMSMELVSRTYSADFKNVIVYLLSNNNRRSLTDLMPMIGARYYTQIEALQRRSDVFEDLLSCEVDNSRLLRILIKLGVVNERPELKRDHAWSETGDRYLLKLFRDHLFHCVTEDGEAFVDLAHLTRGLNCLDSGVAEKDVGAEPAPRPRSLGYGGVAHPYSQLHDTITKAVTSAVVNICQVELVSRDEQSVLVVTYSELKHCLETAFEEVMGQFGRST